MIDHIYVIGGKDNKGNVVNTIERYSLVNNNWSILKSAINKRYAGAAVAI